MSANLPPGVTEADLTRGTWDPDEYDRFVGRVERVLAERGLDYYSLSADAQGRVDAAIERHSSRMGDDAQRVGDAVYDDWCERGCA